MVSIKDMIKVSIKDMIKVSVVPIFALLTPCIVSASPQKTIVKDNRTYTVQDKSGQNISRAFCDVMEVGVVTSKMNDAPPNVMATVAIKSGDQKKAFRLFNIAKTELTAQHDITSMKVGCLTNEGGVGINIPHLASSDLGLKIQIDFKGRVFLKYDEVGLEIINSQSE